MIARCGGGRAAFVGDSIYDITAGRAAGVPTIAVSFGFLDRPVADLGADAVIDSYADLVPALRSEEHTSELQSLMRISYAVFCLKKKKKQKSIKLRTLTCTTMNINVTHKNNKRDNIRP